MVSSANQQSILRLSKPAQDMLQSTRRTLLNNEETEDELADELAELQSEIDKIDAQEEKLKQDEAEVEDAIEEEEDYLDELTGGELPNNGENGDAENNTNDVEKNDEQRGAFMPTKHQMYLAYQTAHADIECDDAHAEGKKDQQEEKTDSGNKAEEVAIQKDMAEVEEEIAKECAEKKNLMQKLVKEAEAECDWDKDEQDCDLVKKLLDLVENAKEDIRAGEVGVWPKTDVIDEGEEYLDELTGGELPNNGENGDAENNTSDVEKNDEQRGAFMPTKHQMYLAYQTVHADIECDDAHAEGKKDQQEEKTDSGNKAEEVAIQKDMAEVEEEIAKECAEKKNLMQKLVKEAEAECDWDKDEQDCDLVKKLLDLVENAKEDIRAGEVGVWPKTDEYNDNDVDIDLASLESELKDAEEKCTKARLALPAGFELKSENAEQIQAVNEGCCLGPYADDDKCKSAIPKEECDVYNACTEAKVMTDQLHNELDNNLDIAEEKCREGAKGILVEKPGKTEGPYDNLNDLDIIRMTCCLAPYDTDMVYCQDKAQVAQVRTNNRCNLLEFCLEANHLVEKQTETKGDASGQVGRGDDDEYMKLLRDDDTGKESSGVASHTGTSGNNIDDSSHDWSATVWLALVLVVLVSSILLVRWKRRKSRKSTNLFGKRRFSRGSMPSHRSSRSKSWNEDAEYGLSDHAAQLPLHHEEDTASFAPAVATSALFGGQGLS